MKENQNNNESIRIKSPIKKNQIKLGEQRSSSMMNMYVKKFEEKHKDKDRTKENGNFYSSGKNFYKLFNVNYLMIQKERQYLYYLIQLKI